MVVQRKTQTPAYWQKEFSVSNQNLEFIYNLVLEENRPVTLDELAIAIVKRHCDDEELQTRSELQQGKIYQPKDSYEVDDSLVFPVMDFALGTVKYVREGKHPDYGTFSVIGVTFGDDAERTREFVTDFSHAHPLNMSDQSLANLQGLLSPEELYEAYQKSIRPKVQKVLHTSAEFVEFHERYFLRDLLTDFHEGLFNIADAAIDIRNGPLSVDALIEQMGLVEPGQEIAETLRFSVSYRLHNDERFDDVGPTGSILWYLERLEPPEAHHPPRRLQISEANYDSSSFDDDLLNLLAEIDDEATDPLDQAEVDPGIDRVTLVLSYPHRRVGTLPLIPKTEPFFPTSHYNPVLFNFIDGRTGDTFPGWTVLENKYVFGLDNWFKKSKLPVGAYIDLRLTDDPMRVIVDYRPTRTQRDWIRIATVTNHQISFQMNKQAISCKYDELMIIGEGSQAEVDSLWLNSDERGISLFELLCRIFPELSKLNPQSTVHAKTLYSAVNVVRRASPGAIFQELTERACFIPMNHGYWIYDPNLRD